MKRCRVIRISGAHIILKFFCSLCMPPLHTIALQQEPSIRRPRFPGMLPRNHRSTSIIEIQEITCLYGRVVRGLVPLGGMKQRGRRILESIFIEFEPFFSSIQIVPVLGICLTLLECKGKIDALLCLRLALIDTFLRKFAVNSE